jgi:xanthine dehydrogenase accessory factor
MMRSLHEIVTRLKQDGSAVLVTVTNTRGSTPREAGAKMIVFRDGSFTGTIGGGALEWLAQAEAQKLLNAGGMVSTKDWSLGPDLGQCCGGRAQVKLERLTAEGEARLVHVLEPPRQTPIYLFGAGHVGRALTLALAPLPFDVTWIDSRQNAFPPYSPANTRTISAPDPAGELQHAPEGTVVAVMTHSHAIDLAIVAAALKDARFPYVGLIGSETKRARFISQLKAAAITDQALARLICPIGSREITSKEASAIAAGIAPQLLLQRQYLEGAKKEETESRLAR